MKHERRNLYMLDLFSGIGGFALAAEIANAMADAEERERRESQAGNGREVLTGRSAAFRSIAHAEVEPFACAVYHRRFPDSVCFGGVQNVTRDTMLERCGVLPSVVTGGFPCQPHSVAGKRKASADERDLWGECGRILGELRPRYALFENVAGLLTSESGRFFNRVISDLAELRYACVWQVVPASAVGAPHRRDRVWIICVDELADFNESGLQRGEETGNSGRSRTGCNEQPRGHGESCIWPALDGHWPSRPGEAQHGWEPPRVVAYSDQKRLSVGQSTESRPVSTAKPSSHSRPTPRTQTDKADGRLEKLQAERGKVVAPLGNDVDGLPAVMGGDWPEVHNRVAQLKGAGNAIVPQVAAINLKAILDFEMKQET